MSMIQARGLTFAYEGSYDNIFENANVTFDTDWRCGFIGRNGRGKTTFLRLLAEELQPSAGEIVKSACCDYFPVPVEGQERIALDVFMERCPEAREWELLRELNLLEFGCEALYRPFETLSGGERMKGMLAALFLNEGQFLLIDEPTNHLDAHGRRALGEYLRQKPGFLLVSHDRTLLDACTDHTLALNKSNIEVLAGNFSVWQEQKRRQDAFEQAENEKLKKDIKRLEAAARQSAKWADQVESTKMGKGAAVIRKKGHECLDTMAYHGEKSRRMQQRRKNLERRQQTAIEEKSQLLKNIETADSLKIHPLRFHAKRILEFDHVSLSYSDKVVCEDISFILEQGERLVITGRNGSGKSSILKAAALEPGLQISGNILRSGQLTISYVPQETSFLRGGLGDYIAACGIDESLCKAILRKLDFSRAQFDKDMAGYSSGQKKKVLIARSLCERAHLYLWDEPLNFIDVFSRTRLRSCCGSTGPRCSSWSTTRRFARASRQGRLCFLSIEALGHCQHERRETKQEYRETRDAEAPRKPAEQRRHEGGAGVGAGHLHADDGLGIFFSEVRGCRVDDRGVNRRAAKTDEHQAVQAQPVGFDRQPKRGNPGGGDGDPHADHIPVADFIRDEPAQKSPGGDADKEKRGVACRGFRMDAPVQHQVAAGPEARGGFQRAVAEKSRQYELDTLDPQDLRELQDWSILLIGDIRALFSP